MRDVHCHILPGVDDGSPNLATSKAMLAAAAKAGVTSIVCTPHCRTRSFSQRACIEAYKSLVPAAKAANIPLTLAYEVYYDKLMQIGIEHAPNLRNPRTDEFLLELPTGQKPVDVDRTIWQLQGMGLHVTIAHPERYACVQDDWQIAEEWRSRGCKLQLSSNFIAGGMFSKSKKTAKRLLDAGLVDYIASDAHEPGHYTDLKQALAKYGKQVAR